MLLLLVMSGIKPASGQSSNITVTLQPPVHFCNGQHVQQTYDLADEPVCKISGQETKRVIADIYEIEAHLLSAKAIKCWVQKRTNYYTHYFFGSKKHRQVTKLVFLTEEECKTMYKRKRTFYGKKLARKGELLINAENKGAVYSWPTTNTVIEHTVIIEEGEAFWQPSSNLISSDLAYLENCPIRKSFCKTIDSVIVFLPGKQQNLFGHRSPWKQVGRHIECLEFAGYFSCPAYSIMNLPYKDEYVEGYGGPGTRVLVPVSKTDILNSKLNDKSKRIIYNVPVLATHEETQLLLTYPREERKL